MIVVSPLRTAAMALGQRFTSATLGRDARRDHRVHRRSGHAWYTLYLDQQPSPLEIAHHGVARS